MFQIRSPLLGASAKFGNLEDFLFPPHLGHQERLMGLAT